MTLHHCNRCEATRSDRIAGPWKHRCGCGFYIESEADAMRNTADKDRRTQEGTRARGGPARSAEEEHVLMAEQSTWVDDLGKRYLVRLDLSVVPYRAIKVDVSHPLIGMRELKIDGSIAKRIASKARIQIMSARIRDHGYALRMVDYCEDARTLGFAGQIRGVCDHERKEVKIGRVANVALGAMEEIIAHELRHLDEPDWDCGNRDVLGRGHVDVT